MIFLVHAYESSAPIEKSNLHLTRPYIIIIASDQENPFFCCQDMSRSHMYDDLMEKPSFPKETYKVGGFQSFSSVPFCCPGFLGVLLNKRWMHQRGMVIGV